MDMKILVIGIIVLFVIIGFVFVTASNAPGKQDDFARCLASKNVTMYGAYWCPHCQNQKKEFGNSWRLMNYVECDPSGANSQSKLCTQKGVTGYPTWDILGKMYDGEQTFDTLASLTGCQYAKE